MFRGGGTPLLQNAACLGGSPTCRSESKMDAGLRARKAGRRGACEPSAECARRIVCLRACGAMLDFRPSLGVYPDVGGAVQTAGLVCTYKQDVLEPRSRCAERRRRRNRAARARLCPHRSASNTDVGENDYIRAGVWTNGRTPPDHDGGAVGDGIGVVATVSCRADKGRIPGARDGRGRPAPSAEGGRAHLVRSSALIVGARPGHAVTRAHGNPDEAQRPSASWRALFRGVLAARSRSRAGDERGKDRLAMS